MRSVLAGFLYIGHSYNLNNTHVWISAEEASSLPSILSSRGVDGVHVDDWHLLEQNLGLALHQLARLPVEARPLQEQSVDVDTFWGSVMDVFPRKSSHEILKHYKWTGLVGN